MIQTIGDPRPLVIHGVQRLFHAPARLDRWTCDPVTSIVVIGDKGSAAAVESIAHALAEAVVSREPTPAAAETERERVT